LQNQPEEEDVEAPPAVQKNQTEQADDAVPADDAPIEIIEKVAAATTRMVEVVEGMTAEEAALVRAQRLSGSPIIEAADEKPVPSQITEGMTAEEAEAARSTRLHQQ
jgi:hypothetical protein